MMACGNQSIGRKNHSRKAITKNSILKKRNTQKDSYRQCARIRLQECTSMIKCIGCIPNNIPPYHLQCNGVTKIMVQTVKKRSKAFSLFMKIQIPTNPDYSLVTE